MRRYNRNMEQMQRRILRLTEWDAVGDDCAIWSPKLEKFILVTLEQAWAIQEARYTSQQYA